MSAGPLSINIKDVKVLYAAYMYFLKNGGLFIPTKKHFAKDDKLELAITLPDDVTVKPDVVTPQEKIIVKGSVAWITPAGTHGGKVQGIGIQFEGAAGKILNDKIKALLGELLQSDGLTHTM